MLYSSFIKSNDHKDLPGLLNLCPWLLFRNKARDCTFSRCRTSMGFILFVSWVEVEENCWKYKTEFATELTSFSRILALPSPYVPLSFFFLQRYLTVEVISISIKYILLVFLTYLQASLIFFVKILLTLI